MKKIILTAVMAATVLVACGPSKEEKEAAEKRIADSIAQVEQARLDSIAAAEQARMDSIANAEAEQKRLDSIANAEAAAAAKKGKGGSTKPKADKPKEQPSNPRSGAVKDGAQQGTGTAPSGNPRSGAVKKN